MSPKHNLRKEIRRECIDETVQVVGRHKRERVDLGLALLQRVAVPGVCYTRDEIAIWAGCTDANIKLIERKALRKVRHRLMYGDAAIGRAFEMLFAGSREAAQPTRRYRAS